MRVRIGLPGPFSVSVGGRRASMRYKPVNVKDLGPVGSFLLVVLWIALATAIFLPAGILLAVLWIASLVVETRKAAVQKLRKPADRLTPTQRAARTQLDEMKQRHETEFEAARLARAAADKDQAERNAKYRAMMNPDQ